MIVWWAVAKSSFFFLGKIACQNYFISISLSDQHQTSYDGYFLVLVPNHAPHSFCDITGWSVSGPSKKLKVIESFPQVCARQNFVVRKMITFKTQMSNLHDQNLGSTQCSLSPVFLQPDGSYGVVPKGLLTFLGFFYAMRSLVPSGHFWNISRLLFTWLVCRSFWWLWVIVYRLYQVRWQGQSDWF